MTWIMWKKIQMPICQYQVKHTNSAEFKILLEVSIALNLRAPVMHILTHIAGHHNNMEKGFDFGSAF
jgi:hypothetical protein